MSFSHLPAVLSAWLAQVVAARDRRSARRLRRLRCGARFARGRRTVTSWLRAAGSTPDCRRADAALWAAGAAPPRAARSAADRRPGQDRPGQAGRAAARLAHGGVGAVRRPGGQDDQDLPGDLAAGGGRDPGGAGARGRRRAGVLVHGPRRDGRGDPGGAGRPRGHRADVPGSQGGGGGPGRSSCATCTRPSAPSR